MKVAVSYHLVARTQSCMGDFRSALNNEKETYAIYKQQVNYLNFFITLECKSQVKGVMNSKTLNLRSNYGSDLVKRRVIPLAMTLLCKNDSSDF